MKVSENLWFPDISRVFRKSAVALNGLNSASTQRFYQIFTTEGRGRNISNTKKTCKKCKLNKKDRMALMPSFRCLFC